MEIITRGNCYLLGQQDGSYGIWDVNNLNNPIEVWPLDSFGLEEAKQRLIDLENSSNAVASLGVQNTQSFQNTTFQITPSNAMATVGGAIGIVGAILSLIPFIGIPIGIVLGILAIIFSSIGISRASYLNKGKTIATVGLVLGILTVIFKLIPGINLL